MEAYVVSRRCRVGSVTSLFSPGSPDLASSEKMGENSVEDGKRGSLSIAFDTGEFRRRILDRLLDKVSNSL